MSDTSPMYQYSIFSPDGKEQIVIRCDDQKEFDMAVDEYRGFFTNPDPVKPITQAPTPIIPPTSTAPFCSRHKSTPMKWHPAGTAKSTGRPYPGFWACPEMFEGEYCKAPPMK